MARGMCSADLERDFDVVYVGPYPSNGVIIERLVSQPRVEKFRKDVVKATAKMSRSAKATNTTAIPKPPTETRFFSLQYYHPTRSKTRAGDFVGWFSPPTGFPDRAQIARAAFLAGNRKHKDGTTLQLMMPEDDPATMVALAAERRASGFASEGASASGVAGDIQSAFRYQDFAFSTNATANEDAGVDPSKFFQVGSKIEAQQLDGRKWHAATIEAIHEREGGEDKEVTTEMDVCFTETGVTVAGVPSDKVRLPRKK